MSFHRPPEPHYEYEYDLYFDSTALIPPIKLIKKYDKELHDLVLTASKQGEGVIPSIKKHLETKWRFNTTMIDVDWYNVLKNTDNTSNFHLGHNPFEGFSHFDDTTLPSQPGPTPTLYGFLSPFFVDVAKAYQTP